jgi:hypothetical protein
VLVKMLLERSAIPRFTSQTMLDTAEDTRTLLGETEVCAASDKMILRFFDVFTADRVTVTGAGEAGRLVAAREDLLRFGAHYVAFKQWIWLYWIARRHLYLDLESVLGPVPAIRDLLGAGAEPPDFFVLEPESVPEISLERRGLWFGGLARLVEPFSPDHSDAPMRDHALRLAAVMSELPARCEDIAAEIARVTGAPAPAASRMARSVGTYAALDALLGDVLATVELGLGGTASPVFDAAMRDRVLPAPPRPLFAGLAPETFAQIARP